MSRGKGESLPLLARYDDLFRIMVIIVGAIIVIAVLAYGFIEFYWRSPLRFRHGLMLKGVPYKQETLLGAVHRSNQPLVWNLLMSGMDPNIRLPDGSTVLMLATDRNEPEIVKTLLEHGADASATNTNGLSALEIAVNKGNLPAARYLSESGATNEVGLTGALKLGEPDLLEKTIKQIRKRAIKEKSRDSGMLDEGAFKEIDKMISREINKVDQNGLTPLIWAILQNDSRIVEILLREGADSNLEDSQFRQTPVYLAIERGNEQILQQLLVHGANLNIRDINGRTPLIWAVIQRNPRVVSALLVKKPDVNVTETQLGMTPLSIAAMSTDAKVVEWLLEAGADPLILDNNGRNSLDWAVMSDSVPVIETMINLAPSKLRKRKDVFRNALKLAEKEKKKNAVKVLSGFVD